MEPQTVISGACKRGIFLSVMLVWAATHPLVGAAQCEVRSAAHRVAVLELYTSEGCNSCPPADRWLSALPARGFSPDRLIPLAFHVDYWDRLGWPDRMAKAQFSARQRAQAERNHARFVYTPQVLLDGADYRPLQTAERVASRIDQLNRRPAGAVMLLRYSQASSGLMLSLDVRVAGADGPTAQTFIAITENGIESAVAAGENQGKRLRHDFAVRELVGPLPKDGTGNVSWNGKTALAPDWKRAELSLVVFVQNERNGEMLQALLTPLCPTR